MIGSLRGTLAGKKSLRVTVDVGGVGYEVQVPLSTYAGLGEVGTPVSLLIHTHVREESLSLFGFGTEVERDLFERLISIPGVGPRTALAILSGLGVREFLTAVRDGNSARLHRVPGVGRKTADRLILEMKDRVEGLLEGYGRGAPSGRDVGEDRVREDVTSALLNLGYRAREASEAVNQVSKGLGRLSFETLLRGALGTLSGHGEAGRGRGKGGPANSPGA